MAASSFASASTAASSGAVADAECWKSTNAAETNPRYASRAMDRAAEAASTAHRVLASVLAVAVLDRPTDLRVFFSDALRKVAEGRAVAATGGAARGSHSRVLHTTGAGVSVIDETDSHTYLARMHASAWLEAAVAAAVLHGPTTDDRAMAAVLADVFQTESDPAAVVARAHRPHAK